MAITVKHLKVSTIPDAGDDSLVEPSDWNADHTITGTVPVENGGTGASTLTGYVKGNGTAAMTAAATIPNTDVTGLGTMSTQNANNVTITGGSISGTTVSGYIPTTEKGTANGVATLDAGGKVPVSELPAAVLGALSYQGTWDAATNTPTLTSSVGTKGYYYVVSVAGNTNLNGITDWLVGDWAVYNGSIWQKVDNTETVTSVNGQTGAVVLTTTNIAEGTNLYYTDARARAAISAGTAISYDNTTGVVTNSAPDQIVALTGAGTTTVTGTYPNFTITSNDEHDGDVVGPVSATDNAIARYDTTTGKLIQNSLVIVDDTGSVTGVNALTAQSLTVNNNATLGSSNTDTLDVNARITTDLEPNANNAKDIGTSGRNWRDGFFGRTVHTVNIEVSGTTSFDGQQGTNGQVLTSAGTGNTPTWTTPTVGTVTSVDLTASTGISVSGGPITSSGSITVTNTAPDQIVSLTGAGTTSISGTYPNFTVTSNDQFTGTVTAVTGTAPVVSSGGNTPAISMAQATGSVDGYLSATDWTTFNNKAAAFTYTTNYIPYGQGTTTPNQNANFTFDGTTQTAPVQRASNGIITNSKTISASYTIPSTDNAVSAGPVTIASGQTVTVSSGSRWVVL